MKDVKEVCCDGSIQTESKGQQSQLENKEQEISCLLLNAEEQCAEEDIEEVACPFCDGSQVNRRGLPCRKCLGTGKVRDQGISEMAKMLKEEVKVFTTQAFQRMI